MAEYDTQYTTGFFVGLAEDASARVLHVDDETSLLKVAKDCLELEGGFKVDSVESVDEAKKKMKKKTYDVIVSDYMMPGKNGLDFLRELRSRENTTPFIMFTGKGREEVAVKALNLGADQYLNKIGDPETVYLELAHGIRKAIERRKAIKRTEESEEKFRNIFENASDAMIYLDKKGRVLDLNRRAIELVGRPKAELVGEHFEKLNLLPSKKVSKLLSSSAGGFARKNPIINVRMKNKKGQETVLECSASLMKTSSRTTLLVIGRDITKRRQAEEGLRRSEERFKELLGETPIGICHLDIRGKITYANKAFEQITGYSNDEIVGSNALTMARKSLSMSKEQLKVVAQRMHDRLIKGKKSHPLTLPLKRKDGSTRWVEAWSKLIKKFGVPVGLQAILKDITERRQSEEKLQKSEERFRSIVENSHGGIAIVDDNFRIAYTNEQVTRILGYSKEELSGKDFRSFLPSDQVSVLQENYIRRQSGEPIPSQYEFDLVRKDGNRITVELKAATVLDQEGRTQTIAEILDVTDRKRAETEIVESKEKFHRLFMGNPEAAVYVDSGFKVLDVNPRFSKLFGYSPEEVNGRSVNDLIVPRKQTQEAEALDKNSKKGYVYHSSVRKRKDGSLVPVAISAAPIIVGKKLIGHVALYKDISKLKKTEDALRETLEKLRVVGGLTRHDVRNKLSTIAGSVYLARRKLPAESEAQEHLKDSESAIAQIEEIFDFARDYEMVGGEELTDVDVGKTIDEAVSLLPDPCDVKIVNRCRGVVVTADSMLRQLFYNLIHNSLKHGRRVTQITIHSDGTKDGRLRLVYRDDGVGVPSGEKEAIFREGHGEGTGYGLYLTKKLCDTYGWTIQETGCAGEGAEFTVVTSLADESESLCPSNSNA